MSLFDWLTKKKPGLGVIHNLGVLEDTRSQAEKDRDYIHEERLPGAGAGDPFGNERIKQSPYPLENQYKTSSCVPHAVLLAFGIALVRAGLPFLRLAQMFVYRLRQNYPYEGSIIPNIFEIIRTIGAPLKTSLDTPRTESEANAISLKAVDALRAEAATHKGIRYFFLANFNSIDSIAEIAQRGIAVPITFYSTYDEWAREVPVIKEPNLQRSDPEANVSHEVCVLPNSGHKKGGVRYVTIQDSVDWGGTQIRHVSEAFIKLRVSTAGYWDEVSAGLGPRPHYSFSLICKSGARGEEVRQIQLLLISEGLLPNDCATGYFGGLTLAGVRAFQSRYADEILVPLGLTEPTNTWGKMCIAKANRLCAA